MQFNISRTSFLKVLSHGQSVVEKKTTVPILSNILIEAKTEGVITLTTTDMDLALIESTDASVISPGITTVSAHLLFDIVKKLPPNCEIEASYNEELQKLTIKSNKSKFELSCLPSEDYPQLSNTDLPTHFNMKTEILKNLIEKTKFATTQDDTRYYLSGIYLHIPENDQNSLRIVATDGHRLASMQCSIPDGAEDIAGAIISRKTYTEIVKLIENEEFVEIGLSSSRIEFKIGNAVLTSRLVEGNFPMYEQAIPKNNNKKLIVPRKLFSEAVDRVGTVTQGDKVRIVKIEMSKNQITISAVSENFGHATEIIDVEYESEDPLKIGFNARYILDVCNIIEDDEICFELERAEDPILIKTISKNDCFYILMPLRVN